MAGKKPNETSMEDWNKAWAEYMKIQDYPSKDLMYSGILKAWIDPKTGKPIKEENKND